MLSSNTELDKIDTFLNFCSLQEKENRERGGRGQGLIRLVLDKHIANAFL